MAQSRSTAQNLTQDQLDAIHKGLADAGLGNFRISALHLKKHAGQRARSLGAAAVPAGRSCHSQQLPNGDWVIVCD